MKFTLGMALADKSPGFFESFRATFTAMSAILHHPMVGEVVIVDNDPLPDNPLKHYPAKTHGKVRYIEFPEPRGTAAPRNHVFSVAKHDHVVVIDPHVLLTPGSFEALAQFYKTHGEDCPDVLHGVLINEAGNLISTHMNDQWRDEMLGTWGLGWEKNGFTFSVIHTSAGDDLAYVNLPIDTSEQRPLTLKEIDSLGIPRQLGWAGHELVLTKHGAKIPTTPFKIPGHGMGMFACRKDSWLPFHPDCRGFGGEEITTGKRFRQHGRYAWCVPGFRWWHHFERPGGIIPYLLTRWDKVRNYILEFRSLGLDVNDIKEHFVPKAMNPDEWAQALTGIDWPTTPAANINPATHAASREEAAKRMVVARQNVPANKMRPVREKHGCAATGETQIQVNAKGLEQLYAASCNHESPINKELPRLRYLASNCRKDGQPGRVVEIAHQSVSGTALMAGKPEYLVCYGQPKTGGRSEIISRFCPPGTTYEVVRGMPDGDIEKCDFLFLDVDPHTGEYYLELLRRYSESVGRYIAIHDTVAYGEQFNGKPGLNSGINEFLQENIEWSLVAHYMDQNGLVVLSRYEDDDKVLMQADMSPPVITKQQADGIQVKVPQHGPGTELKKMLSKLGVNPSPTCDCNGKAAQMNIWGVKGCEEHFDEIVGWMREGQDRWKWTDKVKAAALAVRTGLVFKFSPTDPYPGLIREAIRLAQEKELVNA